MRPRKHRAGWGDGWGDYLLALRRRVRDAVLELGGRLVRALRVCAWVRKQCCRSRSVQRDGAILHPVR